MLPKYILLGSESLEEDVRKSIRLTDTNGNRPTNISSDIDTVEDRRSVLEQNIYQTYSKRKSAMIGARG